MATPKRQKQLEAIAFTIVAAVMPHVVMSAIFGWSIQATVYSLTLFILAQLVGFSKNEDLRVLAGIIVCLFAGASPALI